MKYHTIYADPPWPEHGGGKIQRGADRHYSLMTVKQIEGMASFIDTLAEVNCHLYLWVTNNYLESGLDVMKAWGFRYITKITWLKDMVGLGQYFRGATEDCLFGVKGSLPYKLYDGKRAQGITFLYSRRQRHSQKPEKMRQFIEVVSWPPRIELFARQQYDDWDCWGKEAVNIEPRML